MSENTTSKSPRRVFRKELIAKFDPMYETLFKLRLAKGKERKALKKEYDALYKKLSKTEVSKFEKYVQLLDRTNINVEAASRRKDQTFKYKGVERPIFTESAEKEAIKQFRKERRKILKEDDVENEISKERLDELSEDGAMTREEEDIFVSQAFAELENIRYMPPKEDVVVKQSFYRPETIKPTPWDIPNLTKYERENLSKADQKKKLRSKQDLDVFKDALNDGDEVEIRFGTQKKFFDSQVPKDCFNNILEWVLDEYDIEPVTTTTYTKTDEVMDKIYRDGLPIKDRQGNPIEKKYFDKIRIVDDENGVRSIERKRTLATTTSTNWGVRLQASSETKLPTSEIAKYNITDKEFNVRTKTRWTAEIMMMDITLDLTKVVNPRNRKDVRYEVEIEFNEETLHNEYVRDNGFNKYIEFVSKWALEIMQGVTKDPLSSKNVKTLMGNYNKIFHRMKTAHRHAKDKFRATEGELDFYAMDSFDENEEQSSFDRYENKPRAFDFKKISNGYDYRVTPKLDGKRVRLFIDINGIYEVNHHTGYISIMYDGEWTNGEESLAGTIIDCEYYQGEYYPFDVVAFKGKNVIDLHFDQRMEKIVKSVPVKVDDKWTTTNVGIQLPNFTYRKPFYGTFGGNVYDAIEDAFAWMDENDDLEYDGLILQRNDEPYWAPFPAVTSTMKWKPLDEITVDLRTKVNSEGQVELFSVNQNIKGGDHAGLQKESFVEGVMTVLDLNIPEEIADSGDFIGEYAFQKDEPYVAFKNLRPDKTDPNFHAVVKSNKDSFFRNPVTRQDLTGETLKTWRKWASALKRDMVNNLIPEGSRVLDIGVGRGGGALFDLSRRASMVYGIDPDKDNLKELRDRIDSNSFTDEQKERIVVAKLKGQDTEEIIDLIEDEKVDVITMFFSISFLYENAEEFEALMETIDQAAKTRRYGSMVIIQLMDGNQVYDMFVKNGAQTGKTYKLGNDVYNIKMKVPEDPNDFGIVSTISLPMEEDAIIGVGKDRGVQKEWLASVDILDEKMSEIGFRKAADDLMSSGAILPNSNAQFAKLNRSLVYLRGGGPSKPGKQTAYRQVEVEEEFMSPLPENDSEDFNEYSRIGVVSDKSAFLRSLLYLMSKDYRTAEDDVDLRNKKVRQMRKTLDRLVDEEIFSSMISGNVEHNLMFDKLYARAFDTVKDGEQVDVVYDKKTAKGAAFEEYKKIIRSGYVGFEIVEAVACLWKVKINIISESGIVVYVGDPKEYKKTINILKIGNVSFEPLIPMTK